MREKNKKRVVRIDQSPMNALIWVLQLECGHDKCITQKARPRNYSLKRVPGDVLEGPRYEHCERCKR